MNLRNYSSWLVTWRFYVTHEEPELVSDIRDFTTLFYVIFWRKSSESLESSIESDLGMRFAVWSLDLAIRDFPFFIHCFWCKNRLLKRVSYLLIFVIREYEILTSVIRDPLLFPSVNRARDPPCTGV